MITALRQELSKSAYPKSVPKWSTYISSVKPLAHSRYKKYAGNAQSTVSPLGRFIKRIINVSDVHYMMGKDSDVDKYIKHLSKIQDEFRRVISPIETGHLFSNVLFKSTMSSVNEIFLPVERLNYISLPFGQGWESWKNVRPIRLWWYPTEEMPRTKDYRIFEFSEGYPEYSVALVDPTVLTTMWFRYILTMTSKKEPLERAKARFISGILSQILDDVFDIWVISMIPYVVNASSSLEVEQKIKSFTGHMSLYTGSMGASAFGELYSLVERLRNQAISPQDFLSSVELPSGSSLLSRVKSISEIYAVPPLTQYRAMSFLRDHPYIDLLVSLYEAQGDTPHFGQLKKKCGKFLENKYINQKFWTRFPMDGPRQEMENQAFTLSERLSPS